jgi:hypothetical protein
VKTTINIKKENIISAGRVIDMDKLVNKDFYNIIKNKVFIKPIGIHFWTTYSFYINFSYFLDRSSFDGMCCSVFWPDEFCVWLGFSLFCFVCV